jgi:cell fate regulator YaaT (PSP1 superfamily)
MPILPIAAFEADLAEQDRELYERMKPPSSVVVRFGVMGLIGEFPYGLEEKPGCGTKFVLKTHRGTELGEMLTSTCPNSGCGKSISRKEMLEYIDRSGGKDYPFFSMQGKVLRIATVEDLNQQARIEQTRPAMTRHAKAAVERLKLPMKLVDSEPILGGEKITFYFLSEERIDFRELVQELAAEHNTRIEMRQVGSRDEARLTADYEKCGQHCCCKQFLKVLKPVSMKNAKIQKATLDPLKISGRCGRLMCCLRYEEATYDDLRSRLPKKRTRVSGEFGTGFVLDTQILTQLCLVQLDDKDERVAVPLEELTILGPGGPPQQGAKQQGSNQQSGKSQRGPRPDGPSARADMAEDGEGADELVSEDQEADGAPSADSVSRGGEAPEQQPQQPQQSPQPRREERREDRRPPGQGGQGQGQPGSPQRSGQRPQWPTGGKPSRPVGGGPGGQGQQGGGAAGPRGDRPRQGSQQPQGSRPPPEQQPPRPPQQQPPQAPRDEIDDILADLDTDFGDGPSRGPGPGQGGGGPGEGGGRRRKRKRRRGGGGGGQGPGGPPNGGGGPLPG